MSLATLLYLVAMATLFVAERLLSGYEGVRSGLWGLGLVALTASFVLQARQYRSANDPGLKLGCRFKMAMSAVGIGSLGLYILSLPAVVTMLDLSIEGQTRWEAVWSALWPIVWLAGTLPLIVVDNAIRRSPVMVPPRRVRQAMNNGLAAALGIALVFPLNYVASQLNVNRDLAYFKTTQPGSATLKIAQNVAEPIKVRIFLPPSSEVEAELVGYFEALKGPMITYEVLDQAAHPQLAKELRVRDNGYVAFTVGEVEHMAHKDAQEAINAGQEDVEVPPRGQTELLLIGRDFNAAKRRLKELDEEVHKILLRLAQGERVAYFTTGHGEMIWNSDGAPTEQVRAFRKLLVSMNFKLRDLGVTEGLAEEIPENADVVVILGPKQPFSEPERGALRRYIDRGGALFIALEPEFARQDQLVGEPEPIFDDVLAKLGLKMGKGVLASRQSIVPLSQNLSDRLNLATDQFSAHPATATLAKASAAVVMPVAGHLEEIPQSGAKTTSVVRTRPMVWADFNRNLELDPKLKESKKVYTLAYASQRDGQKSRATPESTEGDSTGKANADANTPAQTRAVVLADSTAFSDIILTSFRANQQLAYDSLNWLIGSEDFSGTIEKEEDVRIRHTKEGQAGWFYGTTIVIPLIILAVGVLRNHRRKRGGAS